MKLVIRADATPAIGAGHVMRCATLAEACRNEGFGDIALWGDVSIPFARARLSDLQIGVHAERPWGETSVLVVDSYDQGIRDVSRKAGARLTVLVDDVGCSADGYDVVWNPNAYPSERLYKGFRGRLISGQVPLRRGLPRWSGRSSDLAVTLGGGTPPGELIEAIETWRAKAGAAIVTTMSACAPMTWRKVAGERMWTAFSGCAALLTGGGGTVWEAAAVGIPACIVITARNQELVGQWAHAHGAPVIDYAAARRLASLTEAIGEGVACARTLPPIENGSAEVARRLREWAA
jgi:hypothetical protein